VENGTGSAATLHESRLERLRLGLRDVGMDGLLVGRPANVRYLCGFSGSSGLLLVLADDRACLITDFRYEEQAAEELPPVTALWLACDGLFDELGARLDQRGTDLELGFEGDWLTVRASRELREKAARAHWEEAADFAAQLRAVKDAHELTLLQTAGEMAERALRATLEEIEEGMTEQQLDAVLQYRLRLEGSGPLPFEPIVASGPRSSLPHAAPGERRLREGDLLLLDFGASVEGYVSDITRTFALGRARPWQTEIHEAVMEAQSAALDALEPGRRASEVDETARGVLAAHGLGDRFGHSTGHGIGLEVHEAPRLARRSDDVLEVGHVVTIEPGVYLPAQGGVRIEDDVVVDAQGPRLLTHLSRDLIEL
jgi:Xaa-Pro aminopeptidase